MRSVFIFTVSFLYFLILVLTIVSKYGIITTENKDFSSFNYVRGISAVGSAQHWQCWGHGFESRTLRQMARI